MTVAEDSPAEDASRPRRASPLTVLIATALINFVFGTLLGGWVAAYFAEQHSDREVQRTWLQERSKHQLAVRKEFLEDQRATVEKLYQMISRLRETSVDLVDYTSPEYAEKNLPADIREAVTEQKKDARNAFDEAVDEWERQRYLYDFALTSYHGGGTNVHPAWERTRDAATAMAQCASRWYFLIFDKKAVYTSTTPKPCVEEEKRLDDQWALLSAQLRAARETAWSDWQNPPQRLK
jgi:hypothetical protein